MAHNVETMAYAGEVPWHGLGVPVSNDLTPVQMMEKAGLNWTVEQIDSYVNVGDKQIPTGMKSLVRSSDNKVLTNIGQVWNPVQNEDAFDLFGGDTVESYLLFSNPHKYGFSIDVRFTPIRVVCNNTLSLSLEAKAERSVKVGHRTEFNAGEVKKALGIASAKLHEYKDMAQFLGSKRYNIDDLVEYYNTVFPRTADKRVQNQKLSVETLSKNAKAAFDAIEQQPGAKFAEGSWWQAFNSVTYVTDHIQGRNADNRLYSSWFGGNQVRKRDALKTALQFAEKV